MRIDTTWHRDAALIDGKWERVRSTMDVEDPTTLERIGTAASSEERDVEAAVDAAVRSFGGWSTMPRSDRAGHLSAMLEALRARRDLLVETTVAEVGAPLRVARESHVDLSLNIFESFVDLLSGEEPVEVIGNSLVLREPAGVVGCITPWNYPLYQLVIKVGAALAAGCTVVAKPAELTPLTAYLLADAAIEAGLPAGVINLVPGSGAKVGQALVTHPGVDVVSFTGSTAVGARIAAQAAQSLKRVSLELGGKSASVALDDADFRGAVRATVDSATYNTGQTCSAWTRLVVPTSRHDEAVRLAVERAGELVIGDPRDEATDLGPLVSDSHRQSVIGYLDRARQAGFQVQDVGVTPTLPGHYVAPSVVSGAPRDSEIVQEEVFGPVLVVQPSADEDDAVEIANDSPYGLVGAVWSQDPDRALAVARRIRTGQVDINGGEFNLHAPFGGYKRSGSGRELGRHGLEEFTELKSIQR